MKLHQDNAGALNTVTAYGPGWIEINRQRHEGPLLLAPEGAVQAWEVGAFEALAPEHLARLLERQRRLERELESLKAKAASGATADLVSGAVDVDGIKVVTARLE